MHSLENKNRKTKYLSASTLSLGASQNLVCWMGQLLTTPKSKSPTEPTTVTSFHFALQMSSRESVVPEDVCLANQQTGGVSIQCSGPNPEGLF